MSTEALLGYCRPGFEPELAAELSERATLAGFPGYAKTQRGSGFVEFFCAAHGSASAAGAGSARAADGIASLTRALPLRELIFARQKLRRFAELEHLDPKDRLTPMLDAIAGCGRFGLLPSRGTSPSMEDGRFGDLVVEHPESDEGKQLAGLARAFGNALRPALRQRGLLEAKVDPRRQRLHVCFLTGTHALLASADPKDSSPWPLGVPRLRSHADAPSRSALKLEEALLTLIEPAELAQWMRAGMFAADLGAAPGGWSWVLARRHLRVTAIDNGPMAESALATGLIEHQRADGFHWQPPKPLDWMVCDMVEAPRKVAARMAEWFARGWCRRAVFNLKLPMKKRWEETRLCLDLFQQQAGKPLVVRAKQLYHDREEITVYAGPA